MMEAIQFMMLPFFACMLLVGINVYFGVHVIKREIIFIDIALAQIAALGGAVAIILQFSNEGIAAYLISLGFTTAAAALFALLKYRTLPIPLEALIGIAYAVSTTGAVVLLDKMAGGDLHVKEMLEGSILWVSSGDIVKLFIVFCLIGGFHFVFREKFFALSNSYTHENPGHSGSWWWDFLFYATFGIAVVHAVRVGGILTVFAFLIIPASIAMLFADGWMPRILIGWAVGTLVSVSGLYLSWTIDIPSGPTVILFLGVFMFLAILVRKLKFVHPRGVAAYRHTADKR